MHGFAKMNNSALVSIRQRACARPARIAAAATGTHGGRTAGWTFSSYREYRKLRRQTPAVALGAGRFLIAEEQRLKLMLAFFADVLKNRHRLLPGC